MEAYPLFICGFILTFGGTIALIISIREVVTGSVFLITEVIISAVVISLGVYLVCKNFKKMNISQMIVSTDDVKGRSSPFYYELEPPASRRELPPLPRDIGREYDPVIMDKV